MDKILICTIDGCAEKYITEKTAPNIFRIAREHGFYTSVQSAMPSVTNVNHACILTGLTPAETKIAGNYFYDPVSGEEGYIEESSFLQAETIIDKYKARGLSTAIAAVKGKVIGVYGSTADFRFSADGQDITTAACTEWLMGSTYQCIREHSPDFVYCTTNDYIFHHFAPGTPQAEEQIAVIDQYIGKICELEPQRQIYITADHGMNQKHHLLDFGKLAAGRGIDIFALPPLKDRYIENHPHQEGGMLYIFLKDKDAREQLLELAKEAPEVAAILTAEEAARQYDLPLELIGDYVLFAAEDCAFAEMETERLFTEDSRTHGSLYEQRIPLIAINPAQPREKYAQNRDIVRNLGIMEE